MIDLDAQANLTDACGVDPAFQQLNTLQMLEGQATVKQVAQNVAENLWLVPASIELATAELTFVQKIGRESFLRKALQESGELYDYVLIDCPPNLGLLTINAFTAADGLLIPVQSEYHSLAGLVLVSQTMHLVRENLNPKLSVVGLALTFYDARKRLNRDVLEALRSGEWADKLFTTVVRDTVALAEAPSNGKTIYAYNKKSYGAEDYLNLTDEFVIRTTAEARHGK